MVDYKDLKDVDLKLCLLSGGGIRVGNLVISPYVLNEIKDYGYTNYMTNLQLMSISMDDFISSIEDDSKRTILEEQRTNLKTLDFYINFGGQDLVNKLIKALSMVFRTDDVRLLDTGIIAIDFIVKGIFEYDEDDVLIVNEEVLESLGEEEITIVNRDNFDIIVEVLKLQNYLSRPEEKGEEQYADEETRKLMELMEKNRKKVEAKKKAQREQDGDGDVDISDIISAVSSKSNSVNKLTIWEFTLYQLYDEYSRLELIDNYDFSIRALMAGAEKIDLKHWSSKL